MSSKLYFAYGANMSMASMRMRCPKAQPLRSFYLRDWRLRIYDHATIEPTPGHRVPGALWQITQECEHSLDRFEGWPYYYSKREIQQDGQQFMVYVMNEPAWGEPSPGYLRLIREGYQDWNLSDASLKETLLCDID